MIKILLSRRCGLLLSLLVLCGCESRETTQLRTDLQAFSVEYLRLNNERPDSVDWESLQKVRDRFPLLAQRIEEESFAVEWYADLDEAPEDNQRRFLAFDMFAPVRGGLVAFYDGSVRNLSANEFEKSERISVELNAPRPVSLQPLADQEYVDSTVPGLRLPLPKGSQLSPKTNAYHFDDRKGVILARSLPVDFESASLSVDMALKRLGARNVKQRPVRNSQFDAAFYEFNVRVGDGKQPSERHFWLLLSRKSHSAVVQASLPSDSKHLAEFRDCLLGVEWTPPLD